MAQVLSPHTTLIREVTKEGEITINLVLTVKIEANGTASVVATTPQTPIKTFVVEDDIDLMIPDIKNEGLIGFGRKV